MGARVAVGDRITGRRAEPDVLIQAGAEQGAVAAEHLAAERAVRLEEHIAAADRGQHERVAAVGAEVEVHVRSAGVGAVAGPEFVAVAEALALGLEEQRAVLSDDVARTRGARVDELVDGDLHGARGSAVADPQLVIAAGCGRRERHLVVELRQISRMARTDAATTGPDVLDEHGAGSGAVTLEQFPAVAHAVGRGEQERRGRAELADVARCGAGGRVQVLDEHGARGGAVGLPELVVAAGRGGGEVERAADVGQLARVAACAT